MSLKSTALSISATTATKVPTSALAGRAWLKVKIEATNFPDPTPQVLRYGDSTVSSTIGIAFDQETDWIPGAYGDVYVWASDACVAQIFEVG